MLTIVRKGFQVKPFDVSHNVTGSADIRLRMLVTGCVTFTNLLFFAVALAFLCPQIEICMFGKMRLGITLMRKLSNFYTLVGQ